jgi:DNA mismatch endonuclease, patch repair protein
VDRVSPETRSAVMSRIRSFGTGIEVMYAEELRRTGIKFQQHAPMLGRPDFLFAKAGIVVFLDSCFWHRCPYHYRQPKSRLDYWIPKIAKNVSRDRRIRNAYRRSGWKVLRFWEHQVLKSASACATKTSELIRSRMKANCSRPANPKLKSVKSSSK